MNTPAPPSTTAARGPASLLEVRLFAGMAAAAGTRVVRVPWQGGTAADLRAAVAAAVPAVAALVARSAVAVGTSYVAEDAALPAGDVALIPPVSGG